MLSYLLYLLVCEWNVSIADSNDGIATGFDLSYFQGDVPASTFQCLSENGYVFGVIEATHGSEPELNPYSKQTKVTEYFLLTQIG